MSREGLRGKRINYAKLIDIKLPGDDEDDFSSSEDEVLGESDDDLTRSSDDSDDLADAATDVSVSVDNRQHDT